MGLWMVGMALGLVVTAGNAAANSNIQESGSVLIFPKVLGTSAYDTLIEIVNTGNSMAHAKCFYINAARRGEWTVIDFDIWLTKQQPTHWVASRGRATNIFDDFGSDGYGFDPGRVPPVPTGFRGELKCVQVDDSGSPLRANKLIGKATLIRNDDGDISSYNAVALKGNPNAEVGNNDSVLELNNTAANQGEYDTCPTTLTVSLLSEGENDPVLEQIGSCDPECPIDTTITLVPCDQDLESVNPSEVTLNIFAYDEFETEFSASITVDCWFNERLDATVFQGIFDRDTLGVYARFIPGRGEGRVVGVAEEVHTDMFSAMNQTAAAAFNLVAEGTRVCSGLTVGGRAGLACASDDDCPGGFCIDGGTDQITIPLFE
jgi:hypothetical protein